MTSLARRLLVPVLALLAEFGLEMSGFENVWITAILWAVAGVWGLLALLTWEPIRKTLPFFKADLGRKRSHGEG